MAGFLDRLKDVVAEGAGEFRTETYPNWRNKLARTALNLGGASTGQEGKEQLHEGGNYALTRRLEEHGMPPWLAANFSDLGYLGNETFTGALARLAGRPFFSNYGFRWGDVAMNRRGQDRALADIAREREAEAEAEEPYRRGWRGIRTASR